MLVPDKPFEVRNVNDLRVWIVQKIQAPESLNEIIFYVSEEVRNKWFLNHYTLPALFHNRGYRVFFSNTGGGVYRVSVRLL